MPLRKMRYNIKEKKDFVGKNKLTVNETHKIENIFELSKTNLELIKIFFSRVLLDISECDKIRKQNWFEEIETIIKYVYDNVQYAELEI